MSINRRAFLTHSLAAAALSPALTAAPGKAGRLNVLLITADDMNWDSLGATGCTIPGITPNLDRFASQGMRFKHAFVNVALCGPCRSILLTGRYAHRNGAMGFKPIHDDVPTLCEVLRGEGYMNGILSKTLHQIPIERFAWDTLVTAKELHGGRGPEYYYHHTKEFIERAKEEGKPFFLMANSNDPHRGFPPYVGDEAAREKAKKLPSAYAVDRWYTMDEIDMPEFLPDIPQARKEVAQYFTAVHRCDKTVGQILQALDDAGQRDNTLVMYLSDHGMAMPFAKANCYQASNKTPWIVRWPGRTKPGAVDTEHFISTIDYMPTVLDALGIAPPKGMDGRSFVPLLDGKRQRGQDHVFTFMDQVTDQLRNPTRCVSSKRYSYIYNAWADGETKFLNGVSTSDIPKAMEEAAKTDPAVAARLKMHYYRAPEEFYDLLEDPDQLHNLADEPKYKPKIEKCCRMILEMMEDTGDPLKPEFTDFLQSRTD